MIVLPLHCVVVSVTSHLVVSDVVVSMRMCCCLQESSAFTGAKIGGKNEAGEVVWLLCCLAGRGNGGWHAFVRIRERIRNPGGSLFSVAGNTKTAKTANKV